MPFAAVSESLRAWQIPRGSWFQSADFGNDIDNVFDAARCDEGVDPATTGGCRANDVAVVDDFEEREAGGDPNHRSQLSWRDAAKRVSQLRPQR